MTLTVEQLRALATAQGWKVAPLEGWPDGLSSRNPDYVDHLYFVLADAAPAMYELLRKDATQIAKEHWPIDLDNDRQVCNGDKCNTYRSWVPWPCPDELRRREIVAVIGEVSE